MKIGGRAPPFPDTELIRALAALLTETGLTEIEYAVGDRRVRVARAAAGPAPLAVGSGPPPAPGGWAGRREAEAALAGGRDSNTGSDTGG